MFKVALPAALLTLSLAAPALAQPAQADVYFLSKTGSGAMTVWVDGQRAFEGQFTGTPSSTPTKLPAGQHRIVVTPFYARPGERDIASATMNVPAGGTYTLKLELSSSTTFSAKAFKTAKLSMSDGAPL